MKITSPYFDVDESGRLVDNGLLRKSLSLAMRHDRKVERGPYPPEPPRPQPRYIIHLDEIWDMYCYQKAAGGEK